MFYSYSNRPPRRKFINDEPSMTIQECAAETDINNLIARYNSTGSFHSLVESPSVPASFEDLCDVPTYHEAMNVLVSVQDNFASLPAAVRDRFQNNPASLLDFLSNPDNRADAIKLGLISAPVEPSQALVEPVSPT